MRLQILLIALSTVFSSAALGDSTNIILIMADDIGYECFGCYGSAQYQTPNIDRLAVQGTRFRHCYSQPLCTPSRVKMMTGLSNVRNYSAFSVLNNDQRTFGHVLQDAGYKTFIGGKWQLLGAEHYDTQFRGKGSWPQQMGFNEHCLWQVDKLGDRYWNPFLHINGENKQFEQNDYGPDIVTDHLLRFMEEQQEDPFLIYYPMIMVHSPFLPSPDSEHRTSKKRQKNFEDMVTHMDQIVGKIVAHVEQLGLTKNTLIIFTGDNGTHRTITSTLNGRTIKGGKGLTTDAGTRVAMIASQPGTVPAGLTCDDLIDFSDFMPTFMELAGIKPQNELDGISFASQLHGKPGTPRESIFCYYNPRPERTKPIRFARDQRWKLYGDGRFYDVTNDPKEETPIAETNNARAKLSNALNAMPSEASSLLTFPCDRGNIR